MNITNIKTQFSDKLSICLSMCCILHCIALPVLILLLPSVASFWINDENVHVIIVLLAIPISLFAMAKSLRIHNNYKCIVLAGIGLFLLVLAIFMHDIGFGGEHAVGEHAVDEHGKDEHGKDEHGKDEHGKDEHGKDEHGHDEHSVLGETLETIFTVMGGLILFGAHFLNIRLTNKSS